LLKCQAERVRKPRLAEVEHEAGMRMRLLTCRKRERFSSKNAIGVMEQGYHPNL
jgi:hypothetical protein